MQKNRKYILDIQNNKGSLNIQHMISLCIIYISILRHMIRDNDGEKRLWIKNKDKVFTHAFREYNIAFATNKERKVELIYVCAIKY